MRKSSARARAFGATAVALLLTVAAPAAPAASFEVLFSGDFSPVIGAVKDGVIYGVDQNGGSDGKGVLLTLTEADGAYQVNTLYTFQGSDGFFPNPRLIVDGGDVFGTTQVGGANNDGTVFRVSAAGQLLWSDSMQAAQGTVPLDGLSADPGGGLYGTLSQGALGTGHGNGSLFRVSKTGDFHISYKFKSKSDGHCPFTGVVVDANGTMYGTTVGFGFGGRPNGAIWQRLNGGKPVTQYEFKDATITRKTETDGEWPMITPSLDGAGNLWGVNYYYQGAVFAGAIWTWGANGFSVAYNFTGGADGYQPNGPLLLARDGFFYGTTVGGGSASGTDGFGVVYRIDPNGGAPKVVHTFSNGADGAYPTGSLAVDAAGRIYGGTSTGVVYRITP